MATHQSLDDLIARKASEFADQIRGVAATADKEEEIRIATERQLAFIEKEAGIKLEPKHEFTLASGRVDSVYSCVIIEYKNPSSPGACIGPNANSPGAKKVVEQIKKRFYDMRTEHGQALNTLFGVGLDGNHFIFVRYREDKWQVQDPVEVNKVSAERFLWALFNMGTKGKPFSPEYLAGDFGSDAKPAQDGIRALYNAIAATTHPKAQTFFSQWKILFGEVCGYDVDNPSDKIKKLADFYGVPGKNLKTAELLFAVHTYYAIFMKLLASEIVAFFHKLPTPLEKMMRAGTSNKLKAEMEDLETGSIFRHLNITNFLEGDLFAWYVPAWSDEIEKLVRYMVTRLDNYNPGTLSEDPAGSRDLLKKLYQQLFPKSVRHDLGEYYTPDWLAEHVLNELGYVGDPDKRLLDPACGSGTFLVMAINRIRQWYDTNREKCPFDEGDLCRKILANIVGFDLNPLAVMAARTNYLIAIRDLIGRVDKVEIPIYLCDSILTPSAHGGLFAGTSDAAKELKTSVARFVVPTEIATNRADVAKYAEQLELCVKNGYSPAEFIARCQDEGLPVKAESLHTDLYEQLVVLDKANKNGVWARIIKNAFAPLFIGQVNYVVGNPPWVNWESLPTHYRQSTAALWRHYDLFQHKGLKAKLGGSKDDISILLTYVAHDCYLVNGGRLGFVITQSVFKTKGGGEGFRRFRYSSGEKMCFLAPVQVHDLSSLQPFEGAVNKTAVIIAGKSVVATKYPLQYTVWQPDNGGEFAQETCLETVLTRIRRRHLLAEPVDSRDPTSPWLTSTKEAIAAIAKLRGSSSFKARKGVYCPTNCIYWLTNVQPVDQKTVLVTNLADSGKKSVPKVTQAVEKDFVGALVRGKDVSRWKWSSELHIILPQNPDNPAKAVLESRLKTKYPKTFAYFRQFEKDIRGCALLKQFFDPASDPFYSSYNVGDYTFKPFKVVWKEICPEIEAAVIQTNDRVIVPDHKLVIVGFDDPKPAFFLCGLLNSSPVSLLVRTYATHTSISGHISEFARLPIYSPRNEGHNRVVALSKLCHRAVAAGKLEQLAARERDLDEQVSALLGITAQQTKVVQQELQELRTGVAKEADAEE